MPVEPQVWKAVVDLQVAVRLEIDVEVVVMVVVVVANPTKNRGYPFGTSNPGSTMKGTAGVSRTTRSGTFTSTLGSSDLNEKKMN